MVLTDIRETEPKHRDRLRPVHSAPVFAIAEAIRDKWTARVAVSLPRQSVGQSDGKRRRKGQSCVGRVDAVTVRQEFATLVALSSVTVRTTAITQYERCSVAQLISITMWLLARGQQWP